MITPASIAPIGALCSEGSYAEDDPLITFGFAPPGGIHLVAFGAVLSITMAIVALVRPLSRDQAQRNYSLHID